MSKKIILLGNSSSGKSTLAKKIVQTYNFPYLDLDTIVWKSGLTAQRRNFDYVYGDILCFMENQPNWIIEGCYGDLISSISQYGNRLIFLNLDIEICLNNCRQRPWEKHKYDSLEAQNANLEMLMTWIKEYPIREDEFSLSAHRQIFAKFEGEKVEYNHNWDETEVFSWLNTQD